MDAAVISAIAVDLLVKVYKTVTAVDGISFALAPGTCTALLGGNGAGKTTTISTIMGLVTPTSGAVTVLGLAMPRQRHLVLHRMNFESPYVDMPMRLTVRQNLSIFAQLYAVPDIGERIAGLAAELELTEFLDRQTGKLSAGQKTRVSLAKSLLNRPAELRALRVFVTSRGQKVLAQSQARVEAASARWLPSRAGCWRGARSAGARCSPPPRSLTPSACGRSSPSTA